MAKVFVHIDHLRLRQVSPDGVGAMVAALRKQLSVAYASPGVAEKWATSGHREHVRAHIPFSAEPKTLAHEAARAISEAWTE